MRVLSVSIGVLTLASSLAVIAPKSIAQSKPYPPEAVEVFMNTCVSHGDPKAIPPEVMRDICACNIREIQKTYTFEEFTRIGTGLGEGKQPPAGFQEMVVGCVQEVLKK